MIWVESIDDETGVSTWILLPVFPFCTYKATVQDDKSNTDKNNTILSIKR